MISDVDSLSFEVENDFFDLFFLLVNLVPQKPDFYFFDYFLARISVWVKVLIFDFFVFVIEFDLLV